MIKHWIVVRKSAAYPQEPQGEIDHCQSLDEANKKALTFCQKIKETVVIYKAISYVEFPKPDLKVNKINGSKPE